MLKKKFEYAFIKNLQTKPANKQNAILYFL